MAARKLLVVALLTGLSAGAWWSGASQAVGLDGAGVALAQGVTADGPAGPSAPAILPPKQTTPSTTQPVTQPPTSTTVPTIQGQAAPPKLDEQREKQEEKTRNARAAEVLRQARAGKTLVTALGKIQMGERELVTATLDHDGTLVVGVVPSYFDKGSGWQPQEDIRSALAGLPRGKYEVIHTDEQYGVTWVVGVGADSAKTLGELDKRMGVVKAEPGVPVSAAKAVVKAELTPQQAAGRFVELFAGKSDATAVTLITVERGAALERADFILASPDAKGAVHVNAELVKLAKTLKAGDQVELEYVDVQGRLFVTMLKKGGR